MVLMKDQFLTKNFLKTIKMTDPITQETREVFQKILSGIAQKNFGMKLESGNSDDMDFYDSVSVWNIKRALEDAFIAGMTAGFNFGTDTKGIY